MPDTVQRGAAADGVVLDYLGRRWRGLDISTIAQAQDALGLRRNVAQRLRLYRRVAAEPTLRRRLGRWDAGPVTVALTENEKLIMRALLQGEAADTVGEALGVPPAETAMALRVLREVGLLRGKRPAAGSDQLLDGIGLNFHTVRVEGEPAFNVH